jgi:hypothetical protein
LNLRPPAYNAPTCKNRGKIKKRKKIKIKKIKLRSDEPPANNADGL